MGCTPRFSAGVWEDIRHFTTNLLHEQSATGHLLQAVGFDAGNLSLISPKLLNLWLLGIVTALMGDVTFVSPLLNGVSSHWSWGSSTESQSSV